MSQSKTFGYTDTAIEGVSALNFPRGLLNFKADWRVKSQNSKELILTNLTSPVDAPEKIRIAYSEISNIYAGSGVEASNASPSKRGVSLLVQLTEVAKVTDSSDPSYRIDLPVSYHLVIKVPASVTLTAADIEKGLGRLVSGLYETGSLTTTRLDALLRGSLVPSDL